MSDTADLFMPETSVTVPTPSTARQLEEDEMKIARRIVDAVNRCSAASQFQQPEEKP